MKECRKQGVDCITAMYEADSQLAYLNKIGVAEYVISEDSDLILFGCKKIIFKLQLDGKCLLFESEKLHMTIGVTAEKFSFEKFRRICILSGCDYLDSLHGIGLAKARKFMLLTEETDMKRALLKIPTYLNMKNLSVTDEYIDGFLKADATFKYMFVYDPLNRSMVRLNELAEDDPESEHCTNAGQLLPPDVAYQLALGNLNPRTFQRLDNFDPDTVQPSANKVYQSAKYPSIWKRSGSMPVAKSSASFSKQIGIVNFFKSAPRVHHNLVEVQNIIDQENNVTSEIVVDDLLLKYCIAEISSKRRNLEDNENDSGVADNHPSPSRNPFAKRHQPELMNQVGSPSLIKSLEIRKSTENTRVTSRFFSSSYKPGSSSISSDSQNESSSLSEENTEMDDEMRKFLSSSPLHEEMTLKRRQLYDAIKNRSREEDEEDEGVHVTQSQEVKTENLEEETTKDDVVDLDKYTFKSKSQKQTAVKPKTISQPSKIKPRLGLSKAKPKIFTQTSDDSLQTKLSKFGFHKKSSCSQVE